MFDLEKLEVRYEGTSYGPAVPHMITRHTHPKARPEILDPPPATPSGIDYLALTAAAHHQQIQHDQHIGFHALYGSDHAPKDVAAGQVPGQLALTDLIDADDAAGRVVS